jgi:hypothetical protein
MTETPEGFLVAHNVPISRIGVYDYLEKEIKADGSGQVVKVFRDPAEVFSPAAIASFEGKPLTDDHPTDGVFPDGARYLVKGAVQNVRRGSGDKADLLLADLIVYDEQLIQEIKNGKREVSAGYDCDYVPRGDGSYDQRNIVGNHVAVVDKGRGGDRVRINDRRAADMSSEEAAKQYGISEKKDGHRTPPEGYPEDRDQYADPVNYKYPLNGAHAHDAIDYFNRPSERTKGGYSPEEWSKIGERIVRANGAGYELRNGKILTPDDRKIRGTDKMPNAKGKPPVKKLGPVTHWFAARGFKSWAQDSDPDPDEVVEVVDALADERHQESEAEAREHESEGMKGKDAPDDAERITALETKINELMDMIKGLKDKVTPEKSAEDSIEDAIKGLGAEPEPELHGEEESHTVDPTLIEDEAGVVAPPDERTRNALATVDRDYRVAALRAIKPIIAAITDPVARKKAADAAIKSINGVPQSNMYAKITQAVRKHAGDTSRTSSAPQPDYSNLGEQWAKKYNPHYKEVK